MTRIQFALLLLFFFDPLCEYRHHLFDEPDNILTQPPSRSSSLEMDDLSSSPPETRSSSAILNEQTPSSPPPPQLPPVATQLNPDYSEAAKATSHVDQTLPSQDERLSQLSTLPTSNGTTHPSLPPLSIPPPSSPSSSSKKSPSSLLPKLKTHPADLVSPSHPDGQHSLVHSPNGSIPFTPIRNSYEDLPSATQADDGGHDLGGFGASFIEDGERDEAGEEREERRLERERERRHSVEGSENGATVGSHEVHPNSRGNGYAEDDGGEEMEKIQETTLGNGLEVVGEEPLSDQHQQQTNFSTPPQVIKNLPPPLSDGARHGRSMSTPPRVANLPPPSSSIPSVFSPSSPPSMSPPTSSNPPSRRPSTTQSQSRSTSQPPSDPTSNKILPPPSSSSTQRSRKEDEQPPSTSTRSRRVLGEYQMTKTLGAGSMGKVKLGVSGISGEKVKTLSPFFLLSLSLAC